MSVAAFMKRMRELGAPPEAIEYAVEEMMAERSRTIEIEAVSRSEREALAARRQADADRQWKRRNPGMSRDVTECPVMSSDIQDSAPGKESPQTPIETTTQVVTPSDPKGSSVPKGTRNRGHRIPDGFASSDEALAVCVEMGLRDDEAAEALAEFRDFWVAVPGAKGTKLDWPATLRNRLREVGRRRPQARASPSNSSPQQRALDRARQAHLELTEDRHDQDPSNAGGHGYLGASGPPNGYADPGLHEPPGGRLRLAPPRPAFPPRPH